MTNRKVYVIRSSDSGNIGVYSNIKKACERAVFYMTDETELHISVYREKDGIKSWEKIPATYYNVAEQFRSRSTVIIYNNEENVDCEIERFNLQ